MEFYTDRLKLRRWSSSDGEGFAKINSDPKVMRYFPDEYSRERSDEMMRLCNMEIDERGFSFWAVDRKDTGELIGFVGLHNFIADLNFCPCVEIGWRLAHSQWGNGFATEAALKSIGLGFTEFGLDEIHSFTTLNNVRSRAVMERIGMINTNLDFLHPSVSEQSDLQKHCLYKITKDEWQFAHG
ncbi:MAG: GNAT family N-acetyltransferase [Granulosicoccus sp.]